MFNGHLINIVIASTIIILRSNSYCFEIFQHEKQLYVKELPSWSQKDMKKLSCTLRNNIENYEIVLSFMKKSTELLVFSLPFLNGFCKLRNSNLWIKT